MSGAIYNKLVDLIRGGRPASLATIIEAKVAGVLPGRKLLAWDGGKARLGSFGPELDEQVVESARTLLADESSRSLEYVTPDGTCRVFIESFPPQPRLLIVGAVHVAIPLCKMAKQVGFHVTILDPRGIFATRERFPEADVLLVEWPEDALPKLDLGPNSYVVVLTHDPKLDVPALRRALTSNVRYAGMIGSAKTVIERKEELRLTGLDGGELEKLHAPIGLRIGSRSPAEIALSIIAEIVAVRRGRLDTMPTPAQQQASASGDVILSTNKC